MGKGLFKGATDAEIKKFEKHIGAALPQEFRDSLRCHNGSKGSDLIPDDSGPFFFLRWQPTVAAITSVSTCRRPKGEPRDR